MPLTEITVKNDYNLNISRYIDSGIGGDIQNIDAHLRGGIPKTDVDGMGRYWLAFGKLKNKLFSVLRKEFYQLNVPKEEVRALIHQDEGFSAYAVKIDTAFKKWRKAVDEKLCNIDKYLDIKNLIVRLAEHILVQFEGIELIDKYDVYQVLLAYWQDVMSDDIYLLVSDGYEVGRELIYEYVIKTKKEGDETVTVVTDKVKKWDGKLIPKQILIDTYFSEEAKEISAAEVVVAATQAQIDQMIETAEEGSAIYEIADEKGKVSLKALKTAIDDIRKKTQSAEIIELVTLLNALPMKKKDLETYLLLHPICKSAGNEIGKINCASVKSRLAYFREITPVLDIYAEDYAQLTSLLTLMSKNEEKSAQIKELKSALEIKVKAKYAVLNVEEIKELLVNKKWYGSIFDGIYALYMTISNTITHRVVELAERYEKTLPEISKKVDDYEYKVKSHLERMGFIW